MLSKVKTTTIAAVALVASSSVNAAEGPVEQLVSALVSQMVTVASQEIKYSVEEAVLGASYRFNLNSDDAVNTKTSIQDIAAKESQFKEEQAQAE